MCGWARPQEEMVLSLSRTNMNWFAIHFDIPQIRWGPMKVGPSVLFSSAPAVSLLLIPLWPETQLYEINVSQNFNWQVQSPVQCYKKFTATHAAPRFPNMHGPRMYKLQNIATTNSSTRRIRCLWCYLVSLK